MDIDENTKGQGAEVWPGRKAATRRLLLIAAILFPCTCVITAFLIGNWNLLDDRSAEAYRHLAEMMVIYALSVCVAFLISLLPTFRRLFEWMTSWRVVRRALIGLAWVLTIIGLFYGEEDWRGRHAWNKYSETLKSQGAELDFSAFVPKPIPDEENFAAIPEIKSWFAERDQIEARWGDNFTVASGMVVLDSEKGPRHFTDLAAWQKAFEAAKAGQINSTQTFKSEKFDAESRAAAAPTLLEELKPAEKQLAALRAASSRPYAQYPVVYDLENPWGILIPHIKNIKTACERSQLKASAELASGQTKQALNDVKLILRLSDSLKEEPFLVSYLVRVAAMNLAVQPVWEGLAEHRWSDAQLQELQKSLGGYDFVATMKRPFSCERAAGLLTADLLAKGKFRLNELAGDMSSGGSKLATCVGRVAPHGWYQLEKLNYARLYNLELDGAFDTDKKRVFPHQIQANSEALEQAFAGRQPIATILTRHQLLAAMLLPALGPIPMKGMVAQAAADQAQLACALERYRLVHAQFPDNLDVLNPDFIAKLPYDAITGEPYKYRRTADGQFILYSIGWNETDDGGQVAMKGSTLDPSKGDWVWQYPSK